MPTASRVLWNGKLSGVSHDGTVHWVTTGRSARTECSQVVSFYREQISLILENNCNRYYNCFNDLNPREHHCWRTPWSRNPFSVVLPSWLETQSCPGVCTLRSPREEHPGRGSPARCQNDCSRMRPWGSTPPGLLEIFDEGFTQILDTGHSVFLGCLNLGGPVAILNFRRQVLLPI